MYSPREYTTNIFKVSSDCLDVGGYQISLPMQGFFYFYSMSICGRLLIFKAHVWACFLTTCLGAGAFSESLPGCGHVFFFNSLAMQGRFFG